MSLSKKKGGVHVCHIKRKCIGCGVCVLEDPANWDLDNNGLAHLKSSQETTRGEFHAYLDPSSKTTLESAEEECPVNIIKIIDD